MYKKIKNHWFVIIVATGLQNGTNYCKALLLFAFQNGKRGCREKTKLHDVIDDEE